MSRADASKDYYSILGADEGDTRSEIERRYKRQAVLRHPDRGGSEEEMKELNEAYGVLRDEAKRRDYDARRVAPSHVVVENFTPRSSSGAEADAVYGRCAGAMLCLAAGLVLLFLVRFQWIWFLWPLAILAALVIFFGVLMAHAAMLAVREQFSATHPLRRYTMAQEAAFWCAVGGGGYGVYLLLSAA